MTLLGVAILLILVFFLVGGVYLIVTLMIKRRAPLPKEGAGPRISAAVGRLNNLHSDLAMEHGALHDLEQDTRQRIVAAEVAAQTAIRDPAHFGRRHTDRTMPRDKGVHS